MYNNLLSYLHGFLTVVYYMAVLYAVLILTELVLELVNDTA